MPHGNGRERKKTPAADSWRRHFRSPLLSENRLQHEFTEVKMTDYEILSLAHRICWKYKKSQDQHHSDTYTFNDKTMLEFVRILKMMEKPSGTA